MKKFLLSGVMLLGMVCAAFAAGVTVQRPANTTTYTTNTALNSTVPGYMTFPLCANGGQSVLVPEIDVSSSANPTTKLQGILWLFSSPPSAASLLADNATFNIAAADFPNLTGGSNGIPFTLASSQGAGAANSGVSVYASLKIACGGPGASVGNVYGLVQVVNAYVPASGEKITVNIMTVDY